MKMKLLLTISLATLLASATQASQEQLASSIKDAHVETSRTSDQLHATVGAINALTQQRKGDLQPTYNAYCEQVSKTEAAAAVTAARVRWMDGDGLAYFVDWQNTISRIANESLRKKAQKRLEDVRASFDKVKAKLQNASAQFKPFLSDLGDIQKALAADVTPGGVKAIKNVVNSANRNYVEVNKTINAALLEMDKMEKALNSEAK